MEVENEYAFELDMSGLSSGVFFVKMNFINGSEKTVKVIKY